MWVDEEPSDKAKGGSVANPLFAMGLDVESGLDAGGGKDLGEEMTLEQLAVLTGGADNTVDDLLAGMRAGRGGATQVATDRGQGDDDISAMLEAMRGSAPADGGKSMRYIGGDALDAGGGRFVEETV